ncbi:MAG: (deoxy)nucleoside triphosphate pyrophosphohydrolase [Nitrospirae bacterium]|jgi:8-oxo-dGTP diphosphatase|nr:(deoxy)nucleoside triphosphate pyrophosphohydrolase [Nitrospirota bacterium]
MGENAPETPHGEKGEAVRVACAVLVRGGQVLAARRGVGFHAGKWEFPGGKIEAGETAEAAMVRELQEELGIGGKAEKPLTPVRHFYPSGQEVLLYPFLVRAGENDPVPIVHSAFRWIDLCDLESLDWLEGDYPILEEIRRVFS